MENSLNIRYLIMHGFSIDNNQYRNIMRGIINNEIIVVDNKITIKHNKYFRKYFFSNTNVVNRIFIPLVIVIEKIHNVVKNLKKRCLFPNLSIDHK